MNIKYKIDPEEIPHKRLVMGIIIMVIGMIIGIHAAQAQDKIVKVADFGAIPGDGKCDIAAIKRALDYAKTVKAKELRFDAGTYDLFVGDAGKNMAIDVQSLDGFTMKGAVDAQGQPATIFLRHYEFRNSLSARPILHVNKSTNFRLQNFIFDNNPRYSTAGEIIANDGQSVTVKIFEGNPVIDGVIFYTGNAWDMSTKTLKKQPSLTYGSDVDRKKEEMTWRVVGDPADRIMKLRSAGIAAKVGIGDGISWSFSWDGRQVVFDACNDLFVENVWTYNAIGFAMEARACENITAHKVKVIAPDNQLLVSPRDGWKLFANRGNVLMDEIYMEGVRWDGQNVHGSFMWPHEIINKKTIWLKKKRGVTYPIQVGSKIGFWNGDEETVVTVEKAEHKMTEKKERGFVLTFKEDIPDFVNDETLCQVYAWNIDNYVLSNSEFRNIAGTASLIRNTNVTIKNNKFDHIMYTAVVIGAAIRQGEGLVPKDIRIENNTISHSGWIPRFKTRGAIGVRNQRSTEAPDTLEPLRKDGEERKPSPLIQNVYIAGNTVTDCEYGIVADETKGLTIEKNKFINVKNALDVHLDYNYETRIENNDIR